VTAVWVYGVSAPEMSVLSLAANAGGTAEGLPFVPIIGMEGFFVPKTTLKT
jgi:hypothetical protein